MLPWFTKHNKLKETHFTNILYTGRKEEHFGDGVSLSDIEAEWESIEEEQIVVTRASENGDEERRTMTDGKEVQGEARDADEQDKAGEMKKGRDCGGRKKTDEEEVKDKAGEMKEKGETVEAGKTYEEEVKDKAGEMKEKGETVEAGKIDGKKLKKRL